MNKPRTYCEAICLVAILSVAGCAPEDSTPVVLIASPTSTPTPRLGAVAQGLRFTWSDKNGQRVADVAAESGAGTIGTADDALGQLRDGKATLYHKGKAVATLTADKVTGDRKTHRLTAVGNAKVQVLNSSDGIPSHLKANEIVWDYDADRVTGRGDVVYTKENVISFPATYFTGDTRLERFQSRNDSSTPIKGTF
ncbi:MAG: hypothetical protein H7145_21590 [Akkermansiaceae bacterium]|nr:hypothetical protein [Armatimonadota bacterium]